MWNVFTLILGRFRGKQLWMSWTSTSVLNQWVFNDVNMTLTLSPRIIPTSCSLMSCWLCTDLSRTKDCLWLRRRYLRLSNDSFILSPSLPLRSCTRGTSPINYTFWDKLNRKLKNVRRVFCFVSTALRYSNHNKPQDIEKLTYAVCSKWTLVISILFSQPHT